MSLPNSWVEKIFRKLSLVYGRDFMSRWEGLDARDVQDDWAGELAGLASHPDRIAYGLANLPAKAPTVLEFRSLCFSMPVVSMPALPAPDAEGLKRIAGAMAEGVRRATVARDGQSLTTRARECLDNLRDKVRAGTASPAQRDFLRRAEGGLGIVDQGPISANGPIDPKTLPPAMRQPSRDIRVNSPEWFVSAPADAEAIH